MLSYVVEGCIYFYYHGLTDHIVDPMGSTSFEHLLTGIMTKLYQSVNLYACESENSYKAQEL